MSRNMHCKSASFGGQALGSSVSYRASFVGEMVEDSVGIDKIISATEVVRQKGVIQVAFRDWDNAKTIQTTLVGTEATLTLITQVLDSAVEKTLTIALVKCMAVHVDAVHDNPGTHIAEFVARSSGGTTNPFS